MKYVATDELAHFSFHDSFVTKLDFTDGKMVWTLLALNATTKNSQSGFDSDMCIEEAEAIFEDCNIESIVFGAYSTYTMKNVLIESVEERTAELSEYDNILSKMADGKCDILSMDELQNGQDGKLRACFMFNGGFVDLGMHFYVTISFLKSVITWDEFSGIAWYEYPEWKERSKNSKD